MRLFSSDAFRRVANVVRTVEKWRPFQKRDRTRVRTGERQYFIVTSDLPTETIEAGTEVFPTTCQAVLLRDAFPADQARKVLIQRGCVPMRPNEGCLSAPTCYLCDIVLTSNLGNTIRFTWTEGGPPFGSANPLTYTSEDGTVLSDDSVVGVGASLVLLYRGDGTDCCCLMQFCIAFDDGFGNDITVCYEGQHPGCGNLTTFNAVGAQAFNVCVEPPVSLLPCSWTARVDCATTIGGLSAVAAAPGTQPNLSGEPDTFTEDEITFAGERYTVNLSLFGGIPFLGELIECRNHGGEWYALGGRNMTSLGPRVDGTDPYRIRVDACVGVQDVPFAYIAPPSPSSTSNGIELGGPEAYGNKVGQQHLIKWNEQERRYELLMSTCTIGVFGTSPQWNPYRRTCNLCGFPCDSMPFVFNSGGACPALDGTYTLYPNNNEDFGCTFSESPAYGVAWVSPDIVGDNGCTARFAAYCVKDSNAAEGVRWVVEYCCSDGTHIVDSNASLQFVCGVVRYAYSLSGDLGCCCGQDCADCSPPSTLYADLSSSCSGWSGTVTLTETAGVWQGSAGAPDQVVDVQLRCFEGEWVLTIEAVNASCSLDNATPDSWTCTPSYQATFTVPLSSDCCPPSGGTLTVEVYE